MRTLLSTESVGSDERFCFLLVQIQHVTRYNGAAIISDYASKHFR